MVSRIGHHDRHPHCPNCHYDLVATVADHRRICPECGYEFELHELVREPRPGDWNIWKGIRRAVRYLTFQSLFCLVIWTATMCAIFLTANAIGLRVIPIVTLSVILAGVGIGIGIILTWRLNEQAGFVSFILTLLASVFAVGVVILGTLIANIIHQLNPPQALFASIMGGLAANCWIVKATLIDE